MAKERFFQPAPPSGDGVYTENPEEMQNAHMRTLDPQVGSKWVQVGVSAPLMSKDQRKTGNISDAANEQLKGFGYTPNM